MSIAITDYEKMRLRKSKRNCALTGYLEPWFHRNWAIDPWDQIPYPFCRCTCHCLISNRRTQKKAIDTSWSVVFSSPSPHHSQQTFRPYRTYMYSAYVSCGAALGRRAQSFLWICNSRFIIYEESVFKANHYQAHISMQAFTQHTLACLVQNRMQTSLASRELSSTCWGAHRSLSGWHWTSWMLVYRCVYKVWDQCNKIISTQQWGICKNNTIFSWHIAFDIRNNW